MPLQNRVLPDGEIIASPMRGMFLGNRGGVIHEHETKTLHPKKRWASRQWICCVLNFKNRPPRELMSPNKYTELFFFDEVTALAAGHRPCFECRRADAKRFSELWRSSLGDASRLMAPDMDRILHSERLVAGKKIKRVVKTSFENIANGSMVRLDTRVFAKKEGNALLWTESGYQPVESPKEPVDLLTPRSINDHVLKNGYEPHWHPSAS